MHQLGIDTTLDTKSVITGIFLVSWPFRGYTLRQKVALWRGRSFSRSFGLWDQFIRIDLRNTVPALQIPVYFLEGRYDYTCATSLAQEGHRILEHDVLAGAPAWPTYPRARSEASEGQLPRGALRDLHRPGRPA